MKKNKKTGTTVLLTDGFFKRCEKSLLPYLQYRNIKKDVRQWIEDIFQGESGFFWGMRISIPVAENVYSVSVQKQIASEDGWITSFNIFDCHGTVVTPHETSSQIRIKVTSVHGLQCFAELCESNEEPSLASQEEGCVFYSSQGTTVLLDDFFDTGMVQAQDVWPNEKLPIGFLLRMPTDHFLRRDSFPVIPRIVSVDNCSFCMPCPNCKGNGEVTCDKCEGSGTVECWKCHGAGHIECRKCNGTGGHWTCSKCGGSGTLECDHCYGAGSINCKKCNGSGDHYSARGNRYDCSACNGTGKWNCRACNGAGEITCFVCKGSGQMNCPVCNGEGTLKCWVCNGDGRLTVRPDYRNKRFIRKYKDEETLIPISDVFLYDPKTEEEIPLSGFWDALVKETMQRFNQLLLIEKRKQKMFADGKSVLECLQRKLDLTPADNEAPVQVVFSSDVPLERVRKHAIYELNIQGSKNYKWFKKRISPWPENTPVCFSGIDFESDRADDITFCGVDFEKRTITVAIASKYNIAPIKNGIQRLKSSAPVPPEKREIQYLNYWLDKDSDTVFDSLAKGVRAEEYPVSKWFNRKIKKYPSQVQAVCQGVSDSPILLLQGPPGTGKTTVIVEIILQAIAQNKRVLLTSQTHQAVCNVLEKLHFLKESGKISVSMVRYAKQEGKLSDIERMYLAGYHEDELKTIFERSQKSLEDLKAINDSLLSDKAICEQAYHDALSVERIKKKREDDLQKTRNRSQKKEDNIKQFYAGRQENERNAYRNNRESLDRKLTLQQKELDNINRKITKNEQKIAAFSNKLAKRQSGSWSDKLFKITDHLKVFGTQSVENMEEELDTQKSLLESNEHLRRDSSRDISVTRNQIRSCDSSYAALVVQLEEKEKQDIRDNIQERDSQIVSIRSAASNEIKPYSDNLTNAVRSLRNVQEGITVNSSSKEWFSLIKPLEQEIASRSREIAIKTEWLRDIMASPEAIGHFLNSQVQVFMATCVGLGGWQALQNGTYERFNDNTDSLVKTKFDLVIVDEAGHATFAETVIPLCFAKKILLIGDDKQLPPILGDDGLPCHVNMPRNCLSGVNGLKNECWFEYSFFSYLWNDKELDLPHLMLDTQFRMHPVIGDFISNSFYEGKLKNGVEADDRHFSFTPFVKPVCVVSTSNRKNRFDEISGTSYYNEMEVFLVAQTVKALIGSLETRTSSEQEPVSLAVITPYARQVELMRKELAPFFGSSPLLDFSAEHIASVDKFQGSERDIIITSFVRSPKPCPVCGGQSHDKHCRACQGSGHKGGKLTFVQDLKRMNVAFSRARKQLILIGDIDALCKYDGNSEGRDVLNQFYSYVQKKGRILHVWESEE